MSNRRESNTDEVPSRFLTLSHLVPRFVWRNNGSSPTLRFIPVHRSTRYQNPHKLCGRVVGRGCAGGGVEEVNGKMAQHQDQRDVRGRDINVVGLVTVMVTQHCSTPSE
jgi:hypothetical protein